MSLIGWHIETVNSEINKACDKADVTLKQAVILELQDCLLDRV